MPGFDRTALGGPAVLGLLVAGVVGYMWLERYYPLMVLTLVATLGGLLLNLATKGIIHRGRPAVVPHLREIATTSFPSGHAMLSAVVYLTLGMMLTRIVTDRKTKLYFLVMAGILTMLVGTSRVYLGVHYPTDVLAGWMLGIVWALVCWAAESYSFGRKPK